VYETAFLIRQVNAMRFAMNMPRLRFIQLADNFRSREAPFTMYRCTLTNVRLANKLALA
jgi:hypothetical protein